MADSGCGGVVLTDLISSKTCDSADGTTLCTYIMWTIHPSHRNTIKIALIYELCKLTPFSLYAFFFIKKTYFLNRTAIHIGRV